jgi:hypothetical protein
VLRSKWTGIAIVFALVALVGGLSVRGDASGAEPEKKLFETRWYQGPGGDYDEWMTLSTSALYFWCGASEDDCASRWEGPTNAAIDDWNSQPTTVRLERKVNQSEFNDMNILIVDVIMGDPGLLGIALPYDDNQDFCFEDCEIRFGDVYAADWVHDGPYGTAAVRQATMVHEIGHQFGLMHESVDAEGYSVFPCGQDYLGSIPTSIMSYACIDPAIAGGSAMYTVQPWDVCGVNHAYPDPGIGYAGCDGGGTPTPVPSGTPAASPPPGPTATHSAGAVQWANADCDSELSTRDNQAILRVVLSQPQLSQTQPCTPIGEEVSVDGYGEKMWADADCDGELTTRDNQGLLRKILSQGALSQTAPCPPIGDDVGVG